MWKVRERQVRSGRLSLYPMKFEGAVRALAKVKLEKSDSKKIRHH